MSLPQWKGLFDWSIKYQDGTTPSTWDPKDYDPEKMKWRVGLTGNWVVHGLLHVHALDACPCTHGSGSPAGKHMLLRTACAQSCQR